MINMKKYLFFLGMALVALIFSSCNGKKGVFTPTSSGRAYEILVVVDHALYHFIKFYYLPYNFPYF